MSSTYIPPHKRNQTKIPPPSGNLERQRAVLDDKDFVPLVSQQLKISNSMAWKSVSFDNARAVDAPLPSPKTTSHLGRKTMPKHVESFYPSDSDDSNTDVIHHSQPLNDDGWTLVEKKVRVKRDKVQEALDNGDAPLSDDEEEQSFWDDQPEEYETYWDRKP